MDEIMLKIDNVSKEYRLGEIGGTTLRDELQRWSAKRRGKEDPTMIIGAKYYNRGETFLALDGVSFEVKKGERIGIIGHNGAGKSTLLKLISRVTAPTGGTIGLNGRVASMLEVGTGFHPELTGRENIYMNGAILGMTKAEIDKKMEDIIEFSECRQFIDTPVKRYSSGMYVKLAFSVAAHLDSEIMIMDEVLAVGDMAFQKKCIEKMKETSTSEGRTILYVSHNMNTVRQLCNRCLVLDKGKICFEGDIENSINTYLGLLNTSPQIVDLSVCKRTQQINNAAVLREIRILHHDEWRINAGEKLVFEITVQANRELKNVGYRSRVVTAEGQSVTVLMAPKLLNCKKGEKLVIPLEADISELVPAKYTLTPVLYGVNEYGGWEFYDSVPEAITLEVLRTMGFNENMNWDTRYWGHVKFPNIVDLRDK